MMRCVPPTSKCRLLAALALHVALLAVASLSATIVLAEEAKPEEKKLGWFDTGELSFVMTSGNSSTETLGVKNTLTYVWEKSLFKFGAGGIRATSQEIDEFAVGSPDDFDVKDGPSETTAEAYYLNLRYDRKISEAWFWYGGVSWDRNIPSGIQNRSIGIAGLGNIWLDSDTIKFKTDYAATYTKEEQATPDPDPDFDDTFFGFRFSYAYLQKFGTTTTFTSDLILDENLTETSDYRADWTNAVAVTMTSHLALKASLRWLYDHRPAFQEIPIYDASDLASGTQTQTGSALIELHDLDTVFTTSLIVNF